MFSYALECAVDRTLNNNEEFIKVYYGDVVTARFDDENFKNRCHFYFEFDEVEVVLENGEIKSLDWLEDHRWRYNCLNPYPEIEPPEYALDDKAYFSAVLVWWHECKDKSVRIIKAKYNNGVFVDDRGNVYNLLERIESGEIERVFTKGFDFP